MISLMYKFLDALIVYHFRSSNELDKDIALSITVFPNKKKIYAIFFGCEPRQVDSILARLLFAGYAACSPFTLMNTFMHIERPTALSKSSAMPMPYSE